MTLCPSKYLACVSGTGNQMIKIAGGHLYDGEIDEN